MSAKLKFFLVNEEDLDMDSLKKMAAKQKVIIEPYEREDKQTAIIAKGREKSLKELAKIPGLVEVGEQEFTLHFKANL